MADLNTDTAAASGEDTLAAQLLADDVFPRLVEDCDTLVASEIKRRGMALRTAFGVVSRIKPAIVERAVRELLPEFVRAMEPLYQDYRAQGRADFAAFVIEHQTQVADAMLTVADRRAQRIHSRPIRSAYQRVRGRAEREIIDAMPHIAATLARYVD